MSERQDSIEVLPTKDDVPIAGKVRKRVLVVDDERAIANTLAQILELSGYAATAVYDAETALENALEQRPELLITDVVLPGIDGIELAVKMRRIYPECKVLLCSGHVSKSDLMTAANREGHHFTLLTKPVPPRELLKRVGELLRGHWPNPGLQSC